MLTAKYPFDGKNFVQLQLMVQKTEPYFPSGSMSRSCEKLIKGMLVKDPTKRMTLDQVMKNSWFKVDFVPVKVEHNANTNRFFDEEDPTLAEFMTPDDKLVVKKSSMMSTNESKLRPIKQLNAFELINIAAFDVANIFDEDENTVSNATRFVSKVEIDRVQAAIIERATALGSVAHRQTQARVVFECQSTGQVVTMRTYQVIPGVCVYDFSRDEGGREHFHTWFANLRDENHEVGKLILNEAD
jgi:serine/threonine protein kinase